MNFKHVNLRAANNLLNLALYCVKLNSEVIRRGLSGENIGKGGQGGGKWEK